MTTSVLTESELRSKLFKEFYKENFQRNFNIKTIKKILKENDGNNSTTPQIINNTITLNLYLPIFENLDRSNILQLPEEKFSLITNNNQELPANNDNTQRNDLKYVEMKYQVEFLDLYDGINDSDSRKKDIEDFNKAYQYFQKNNNLTPNSKFPNPNEIRKTYGDYTLCIISAYVHLINIWFSEFQKSFYTGFTGLLTKAALSTVNATAKIANNTSFLIYSNQIYPAYNQYYATLISKIIMERIDLQLSGDSETSNQNIPSLESDSDDVNIAFNARSPMSGDTLDAMNRTSEFNAKIRKEYLKEGNLNWDPEKSLFDVIINYDKIINDKVDSIRSDLEYARSPNIGVQGTIDTLGLISLFSSKLKWVILNVVTSAASAANRWRYITFLEGVKSDLATKGQGANIFVNNNNTDDEKISADAALRIVENSIWWHYVFLGLEVVSVLPFLVFCSRVMLRLKYRIDKSDKVIVNTYGTDDKNKNPIIIKTQVDGEDSAFFARVKHSVKKEIDPDYNQQASFDVSNLIFEKILNPLKTTVDEDDLADIIFKFKAADQIETKGTEPLNFFYTNTKTYKDEQIVDVAEKLNIVTQNNGVNKTREELISDIYKVLKNQNFPNLSDTITQTKTYYPDIPPQGKPFNTTKTDEEIFNDYKILNPSLDPGTINYDSTKKAFFVKVSDNNNNIEKIYTTDWDSNRNLFVKKVNGTELTATPKDFKNVNQLIIRLKKELPGALYKSKLKDYFKNNELINNQDALTVLYETLNPKDLGRVLEIDKTYWPGGKPDNNYLILGEINIADPKALAAELAKYDDTTLAYLLNKYSDDSSLKAAAGYDQQTKAFKFNNNITRDDVISAIVTASTNDKKLISDVKQINAKNLRSAMLTFTKEKQQELANLTQKSVNIANGMARGLIIVNENSIQSVLAPLIEALKRMELTIKYNLLRTEKIGNVLLGNVDKKELSDIAKDFLESGSQTAIVSGADAADAFDAAKKSLEKTKGTIFDISGYDKSTSMTLNFTGSIYSGAAASYGTQAANMYRQYAQNLFTQTANYVNILQELSQQINVLKTKFSNLPTTADDATKFFYANTHDRLENISKILNEGINGLTAHESLKQSGRNITATFPIGSSKLSNAIPEQLLTHDFHIASRVANVYEVIRNIWNRLANETGSVRAAYYNLKSGSGEKNTIGQYVKQQDVIQGNIKDAVVPNESNLETMINTKTIENAPTVKPVDEIKQNFQSAATNPKQAIADINTAKKSAETAINNSNLPEEAKGGIKKFFTSLHNFLIGMIENPLATIVGFEALNFITGSLLMKSVIEYTEIARICYDLALGAIAVISAKLITVAVMANSANAKGFIKNFFSKYHRIVSNFIKQGMILKEKIKEFKKEYEKNQTQKFRQQLLQKKKFDPTDFKNLNDKLDQYTHGFENNYASVNIDSTEISKNRELIGVLTELQKDNIIKFVEENDKLMIEVNKDTNITNNKNYKALVKLINANNNSDLNNKLKNIDRQILMASFFTKWNQLGALTSKSIKSSNQKSWQINKEGFTRLSEQLQESFKKDYQKFAQYQNESIYANLIRVPNYITDEHGNLTESDTNISNLYKKVCDSIDGLYRNSSFSSKLENISKEVIQKYYPEKDLVRSRTKFVEQFGEIDNNNNNINFRKSVVQYLHFMSILDEFFRLDENTLNPEAFNQTKIRIYYALFNSSDNSSDPKDFLRFQNAVKSKKENIVIKDKMLIDRENEQQKNYVIILNRLIAFLGKKGFFTKRSKDDDAYLISRDTIVRLLDVLYFYGHKMDKEHAFYEVKKVYKTVSDNYFDFNAMLTQGYSKIKLDDRTAGELNIDLPFNSDYKYTNNQNYFEKMSDNGEPFLVSELKLLSDQSELNTMPYDILKVISLTSGLIAPIEHSIHNFETIILLINKAEAYLENPDLNALLNEKSEKNIEELQEENYRRKSKNYNRVIMEHSYKKGRKLLLLEDVEMDNKGLTGIIKNLKNPSVESIINGQQNQYFDQVLNNIDEIDISSFNSFKNLLNININIPKIENIIDFISQNKNELKNSLLKLQRSEKFKGQILKKDFSKKGVFDLTVSDNDYVNFVNKKTISEQMLKDKLNPADFEKINNDEMQKKVLERSNLVNLLVVEMISKINNLSKKDEQINLKALYKNFIDDLNQLYSNKDKNVSDEDKNSANYKQLNVELQNYLEFFKNLMTIQMSSVVNFKNDKLIGYYSSDNTDLIDRLVFITDLNSLDANQKNELGVSSTLDVDYINNLNVVYEIDVSELTQFNIFLKEECFSEVDNLNNNKFVYFQFNNKVDKKKLSAILSKKL